MFADDGPLNVYVDISLIKQLFTAMIVIYSINSVYTVFRISFML